MCVFSNTHAPTILTSAQEKFIFHLGNVKSTSKLMFTQNIHNEMV